jgi:hypothetical protein
MKRNITGIRLVKTVQQGATFLKSDQCFFSGCKRWNGTRTVAKDQEMSHFKILLCRLVKNNINREEAFDR